MSRKIPYAGQRNQRTEIFRLVPASLTGSFASSLAAIPEGTYHCTAKKTATGAYQLQLNADKLYARPPNVTFSYVSAAGFITIALTAVPTAGGLISFNAYTTTTGAAVDPTQIIVTVEGSDSVDQV